MIATTYIRNYENYQGMSSQLQQCLHKCDTKQLKATKKVDKYTKKLKNTTNADKILKYKKKNCNVWAESGEDPNMSTEM